MKRNIFRSIIAAAMAAALALICVFATACDTVNYAGRVANFRPYDFNDYITAYTRAENAISGNNPRLIVPAINNLVSELSEILDGYRLVNIEYNKDTESKFKEYYRNYRSYYSRAYSLYIAVLYDALNSRYGASLFYGWSNDEIQNIVTRYNLMSDSRYIEIEENLTELEMEYDQLDPGKNEADANAAQEILLQIVEQNNLIADISGSDSYVEYAYEGFGRTYEFDKAVEMCEYVKEYISPLLHDLGTAYLEQREKSDEILSPDAKSGDEITRCEKYVRDYAEEIGSYMSAAYRFMIDCDLHYSANSVRNPRGLTGAFTTYLDGSGAPYIYQYCTGGYGDLMTYVHEFGHFTSFKTNGSYGGYELDVAEIQSQGNEMLFLPYLTEIYGETAGEYMERAKIYNFLTSAVVMGCLLDEFQRIIYANPENYSAPGAMTSLFQNLLTEYGADIIAETSENPDTFKYWWAIVRHTFASPFYYISYAVSALPALVLYMDENTPSVGREETIEKYNFIQQYGHGAAGGLALEDLLARVEVGSPFEESTISALADFLESRFLS